MEILEFIFSSFWRFLGIVIILDIIVSAITNNSLFNIKIKYGESNDKIAFHPGYYIKEFIDYNGLSIKDFAEQLGIDWLTLNSIIRGEQNISFEIAEKLSKTIGASATYWMNLQKGFDDLTKKKS